MPMNFPDESLKSTAQVHKFRERLEDESIEDFRLALHEHVKPTDHIESFEIKFGIGWDQWSSEQKTESLGMPPNPPNPKRLQVPPTCALSSELQLMLTMSGEFPCNRCTEDRKVCLGFLRK